MTFLMAAKAMTYLRAAMVTTPINSPLAMTPSRASRKEMKFTYPMNLSLPDYTEVTSQLKKPESMGKKQRF